MIIMATFINHPPSIRSVGFQSPNILYRTCIYLQFVKSILDKSTIEVYPIIGNHECYATGNDRLFINSFKLDKKGDGYGYYSFDKGRLHFIMLHTFDQNVLCHNSKQFRWLRKQLNGLFVRHKTVLFVIYIYIYYIVY